jgi:hypothetical protein
MPKKKELGGKYESERLIDSIKVQQQRKLE